MENQQLFSKTGNSKELPLFNVFIETRIQFLKFLISRTDGNLNLRLDPTKTNEAFKLSQQFSAIS